MTSFSLLAVLNVGVNYARIIHVGARHALPEIAERRAGNGFKSGTPRPTGAIAGRYLNPGPPGAAVATLPNVPVCSASGEKCGLAVIVYRLATDRRVLWHVPAELPVRFDVRRRPHSDRPTPAAGRAHRYPLLGPRYLEEGARDPGRYEDVKRTDLSG